MAKGPRDTLTPFVMTGWDATELAKYALKDGTQISQVASELNTALAALNAELANDPLWASLASFTDQLTVSYRMGVSSGVEIHTEYGRPDEQRAQLEGHMLPLVKYDRALGWTYDYLTEDATAEQITNDIADAIKDWRDKFRVAMLTRLLKRGDDSGAASGLGSSGYSPGFATTAAQTSVDFTPPAFGGTTFASTHEHYVGIAGGAFTAAVFQDAFDELREHGHMAPFTFLIGPSDRTTVTGLTGFVKAPSVNIRYGNTVDLANGAALNSPWAVYLGAMEEFDVYEVRGIPQYFGVGYKSYGPKSQRNPLRVRLATGNSAPSVYAMPDPRNGSGAFPLQYLMTRFDFGIGVADRTAATPRYTNNTTWADGTAT